MILKRMTVSKTAQVNWVEVPILITVIHVTVMLLMTVFRTVRMYGAEQPLRTTVVYVKATTLHVQAA